MNRRDFLGLFRSSRQSCSVEKFIVKNFANFRAKHLCWSLFLIALQVDISSAKDCFYLFHLQNTITNSTGEFGVDETSTQCKVSIFFKTYRSSLPEVFCKKVFLEISQNSQKSTCARVSFLIKLQ